MQITGRKKLEDALKDNEERYRELADSVTDVFFAMDEHLRYIYWNKSSEVLTGILAEDAIGKSIRNIFPDTPFLRRAEEMYRTVLRTQQPQNFLNDFDVDGKHYIFDINAYPSRGGISVLARDVTERKKAEEAQKGAEEEKSAFLEEAPVAIIHTDLKGNITYVNKRFESETGYSREEITYKNGLQLDWFPACTKKYLTKRMEARLKESPVKHWENQFKCKNGQSIWLELEGRILRKSGIPAGFQIIAVNITERKRAEEALKQSEEKYRALFDSTVIGTVVIDSETMKVVMANQAAVRMLGFSSVKEIIGVNPLDFIPPEDRERVSELLLKDFFEQDLRRTQDFRMITKDDREIWISANGARIMHEGRLVGLACFTDITKQKQQNERLMMTDRLASLGELASGAAHELNNPLTSIIGFSQLLIEKEVPDDIREELKLINIEARRAVIVTNNFLSFARKHSSEKQPNQINSIIEDVLELRAYEHKVNHIDVERHLDTNLPEILVDYFQMQQVFMNIIINAEYFLVKRHNKGTLTITTEKENGTVRISFADDGPGITSEDLGRIFDPFFTTKEAGDGTGLGLSICHGIVNEHSGQIYATSQLGKGTTIVIELPIKKPARIKSLI